MVCNVCHLLAEKKVPVFRHNEISPPLLRTDSGDSQLPQSFYQAAGALSKPMCGYQDFPDEDQQALPVIGHHKAFPRPPWGNLQA
jgi:hypothetical protein